jgi:ABC-type transport system involved in multi-copper enzyme maturation permease subunit
VRAIISIASTTIGEAIRRKVLLVILMIGVLFLSIAPGLQVLSARQETAVLKGLTLGVIQLTSAVIAIVLTVYLIPNEVERRTIYTILCKPVQRYQFLLGKYFGAVGALGIMMLLMTLVVVIVFSLQQRAFDWASVSGFLTASGMFFVQMSLLAAVAICFSTMVTPLVNFFLSGGSFLVGSLFATIFETMKDNQNTPAIAKIGSTIITTVLPNFAMFNVQNPIINPGQQIQNTGVYYLNAAGYGVLYITILLIIGMLVFDRKEV